MFTTSKEGFCSLMKLSEALRAAVLEAKYAAKVLTKGGSSSGSLSSAFTTWPDGGSLEGRPTAAGTMATIDDVMTTRLTEPDFCAASRARRVAFTAGAINSSCWRSGGISPCRGMGEARWTIESAPSAALLRAPGARRSGTMMNEALAMLAR